MNTKKKITPPPPKYFNPYLSKKNSPPLSAPLKKSPFSQKQHPHHPIPLKKNQPPKSPRSHENYTCSLSTL